MQVFIKIEERGGDTRVVALDEETLRLGRKDDVNHVVLKRRSVSRKHAIIAQKDGRFILADLKSAGGTFVNGERIKTPTVIKPGDRIIIGEYQLSLVVDVQGDASGFEEEAATRRMLSQHAPTTGDSKDDIQFGDAGEEITLFHAEGGADRGRLERAVLQPAFRGLPTRPEESAQYDVHATTWISSSPRVFPGGDLGSLTIARVAGHMAARGAEPHRVQVDLFAEEGLGMQELHRHLRSMRASVWDERFELKAGDVHVGERGTAAGLIVRAWAEGMHIITPTGEPAAKDRVLLSGPVGAHGTALAAQRAKARLDVDVFSDATPVTPLLRVVALRRLRPRSLAYPFAGGLAHALQNIAQETGARILVDEQAKLISDAVRVASLNLDLDPLFEPSAGRLLAVVKPDDVAPLLDAWAEAGAEPVLCGEVLEPDPDGGAVVIGTPSRHKPLRRFSPPELDDM